MYKQLKKDLNMAKKPFNFMEMINAKKGKDKPKDKAKPAIKKKPKGKK